jgi:hypothetical protein
MQGVGGWVGGGGGMDKNGLSEPQSGVQDSDVGG